MKSAFIIALFAIVLLVASWISWQEGYATGRDLTRQYRDPRFEAGFIVGRRISGQIPHIKMRKGGVIHGVQFLTPIIVERASGTMISKCEWDVADAKTDPYRDDWQMVVSDSKAMFMITVVDSLNFSDGYFALENSCFMTNYPHEAPVDFEMMSLQMESLNKFHSSYKMR